MNITQEHMNRFRNLGENRRKSQDALYDRLLHNHIVEDLIDELNEDLDE